MLCGVAGPLRVLLGERESADAVQGDVWDWCDRGRVPRVRGMRPRNQWEPRLVEEKERSDC